VQLFIRSGELSVVCAGCREAKSAQSDLFIRKLQPAVWNINSYDYTTPDINYTTTPNINYTAANVNSSCSGN